MKCGNTQRLIFMIVLVIIYFFVELIVGYLKNSLALVADSFHMLSDFIALCVGVAASRIAKWPRSSKNTFGWQRAEVVGSLVNTVVLVTLCFTIFVNAIERFIEQTPVKDPETMVYVGLGGLVINVLGLIVIGGHSHSHDAPALTLDMEDVSLDDALETGEYRPVSSKPEAGEAQQPLHNGGNRVGPYETIETQQTDSDYGTNGESGETRKFCCCSGGRQRRRMSEADLSHENCHLSPCPDTTPKKQQRIEHSMNMRAVMLHVFADFLGSVIVVASALILWKVPGDPNEPESSWKLYVDPAMSLFMVCIILWSTIPLLYKAALILLQSVPKEVCIRNLKTRLEKIEGILRVHDLHVWKLQSNCIIGTVHLRVRSLPEYVTVAKNVKQLFHEYNIHCTTIQPEFEELHSLGEHPDVCLYECGTPMSPCIRGCCPSSIDQRQLKVKRAGNKVVPDATTIKIIGTLDDSFSSSSSGAVSASSLKELDDGENDTTNHNSSTSLPQ